MSGKDQTVRETEVMNFINKEKQDAVVTSVRLDHTDKLFDDTLKVECYSPVWKTFHYTAYFKDIHRGDILTFSRKEIKPGKFEYQLIENKTVKQIRQNGIDKILSGFNAEERQYLMLVAEKIRLDALTKTK